VLATDWHYFNTATRLTVSVGYALYIGCMLCRQMMFTRREDEGSQAQYR